MGHREVADIDVNALRNLYSCIAVDRTAVPTYFVKVFFGFNFFFIVEVVD